jgi:hypothetical protein
MNRSPVTGLACALPFLAAALLGCSPGGGATLKPLVASNIVVDGTGLVLVDDSEHGGALVRVDIASGDVTTLFQGSAPHQMLGDSIAADATRFYFSIDDEGTQQVFALPRAGGAPVPLTPKGTVGVIAVNATHLYWNDGNGEMQAPLQGGAGTPIPGIDPGSAFAVDDDTMYWARSHAGGTGDIVSAPVAGGAPTVLATGLGSPIHLSLGSDALYWVDEGQTSIDCGSGPGDVSSVPKSGGSVRILAKQLYDTSLFAVSGTTAVVLAKQAQDGCSGDPPTNPWALMRIDGDGPPRPIATPDIGLALATDGTDVYLAETGADPSTVTLSVLH